MTKDPWVLIAEAEFLYDSSNVHELRNIVSVYSAAVRRFNEKGEEIGDPQLHTDALEKKLRKAIYKARNPEK